MEQNKPTCPMSMAMPETMVCPFPTYDAIREEKAIYQDPLTKFYVVTRYADIRAIADDPQTFSNRTGQLGSRSAELNQKISALFKAEGFEHLDTLVTNDQPSHTRYRSLVDKAFNALRVRAAEETILSVTNSLIEAFPQGPFDFVKAFSIPLPIRMIAEQLGVPPERGSDFKRWSDALLEQANQGLNEEQLIDVAKRVIEMQQFFAGMIREARKTPTETLLSDLANMQLDGELMSERELVSILQQLLVAGNETTTNAITAAILRLAEDPALQSELRANPQLIRNYCEEVLRLDAPLQGLFRIATQDTQVGETPIPKGTVLDLRWGAGNRDPQQYQDAEKVDVNRKAATQHLAFGHGIHFCIGNQLARAEMRTALTRILAQSTSIRLVEGNDSIVRQTHFIAYGIRQLMVEITKA
ncbi:cytochrome P450 [Pseudomonas sp. OTU5201]|uniref:cytochrome P450 n=1 Tax=Pseudomonas sp. OTU5201 TaxID=3043850 RepID=UPI00313D7642